LTESIVSGKRRKSKQKNRSLLDSIIRKPSLTLHRNSALSFRLGLSPASNRSFLWWLLALCGVVAPIIMIVMIVVGAAVTSGYNHATEPISQLAATGSPHPLWVTAGFISYGIIILGFGFVLYQSVRNHRFAWLVLLFLFLHGIGFLLGGVFSDDSRATGSVSTVSGILHNVWIIIGCSSFVAGMFTFAWLERNNPAWRGIARIFMVFLVIILLTFAVSQIPALATAEGVMQRVYGFLAIVLIEIAAVRLLISLGRRQIDPGGMLHLQS
jgi:hypothetical membrane protein